MKLARAEQSYRIALLLPVLLWLGICTASARTLHLQASGAPAQQGAITRLSRIPWNELAPGDTLILHDSAPYREVLYVEAGGSAEKPLTIKAAAGEKPVIEGSVVIADTAHVVLDGLTVLNSAYPGVIIKEGSHHIKVSNCTIRNNGMGVWITDSAGMENRIVNNEIFSNKTHGVAVDRVNCARGRETVIADNRIYDNGHHGVEINGNYYIVEHNEVFRNGAGISGASGIHFFSKSARQDLGKYNIARYNIVHANIDKKGPDGNGIQADQWCDHNQIYYNVVFNNDGSGISLFDSAHNMISNNTLFNNVADPGKSHPYKGEIALASDYVHDINRVTEVVITNNIVVANAPSVYAIYVDKPTSGNDLLLEKNLFFHKKAAPFYYWGGKTGGDVSQWNRLRSGSGHDLYRDPLFVEAVPSAVRGFALRSDSPALRLGKPMGLNRDIFGRAVPAASPDLGAIQSQ